MMHGQHAAWHGLPDEGEVENFPGLGEPSNGNSYGMSMLGLNTSAAEFKPRTTSLNTGAATFVPQAPQNGAPHDQAGGGVPMPTPMGQDLLEDLSHLGLSDTSDGAHWGHQVVGGQDVFSYRGPTGALTGWEGLHSDAAGEDAVLAVLVDNFPGYDIHSLRDILEVNDWDVDATIDMMEQMDSAVPEEPVPELNDDNFPSLGGGEPQPGGGSGRKKGEVGKQHGRHAKHKGGGGSVIMMGSSVGGGRNAPPSGTLVRGAEGGWAQMARVAAPLPAPAPRGGGRGRGGGGGEWAAAPAGAVPWLETGDAVSHMYGESREQASQHARARNAYFQQATLAYRTGQGALAKELGAKGRWHNEQMKIAHATASRAIFNERNTAVQQKGMGGKMLDLHGLHVAEALQVLEQRLYQGVGGAPLLVCVGTGHHTKGKRTPARLGTAVMKFLDERGIRWREPQWGMLQIEVGGM